MATGNEDSERSESIIIGAHAGIPEVTDDLALRACLRTHSKSDSWGEQWFRKNNGEQKHFGVVCTNV